MNTIEKYPEELMAEALSKYSTPYGKPNPETYAYLAGASAMNGSAGVHWRPISVKPPEEKQVLFDAVEYPPVWGKYRRKGKSDYVITQDSSGEENFHSLSDYYRWLDESVSSPSPQINSAGVPSSILRMNDTWPLSDVLKHLIEGTQILLEKKNYDGPTYEQMEICVKVGNEIRELLSQASPSPLEAETADKKEEGKL